MCSASSRLSCVWYRNCHKLGIYMDINRLEVSRKSGCLFYIHLNWGVTSVYFHTGISAMSLYLELFSYTSMMLYNYCYGYSLLSYMEYPVLLIQEYILILLVLKYKRQLNQTTYMAAGGYFAVVLLFGYQILPKFLLALLVVSELFLGVYESDLTSWIFFAAILHANRSHQQSYPIVWNYSYERFNNSQFDHMVPVRVHQFEWVRLNSIFTPQFTHTILLL